MGILYIQIYNNDEYRLVDKFKDETELAKWFAYDYAYDYVGLNHCESRYARFIEYQQLSGEDLRFSYEDSEGEPVYWYRNLMLLEESTYKRIDLRNFVRLIEMYIHDSVYMTEYHAAQKIKRTKQGKKHRKKLSFKYAFARRIASASCRYGNTEYEGISEYNIQCPLPELIRPKIKTSFQYWNNESLVYTENNWKQRKVRHQYQRHWKDNCTSRGNERIYRAVYENGFKLEEAV